MGAARRAVAAAAAGDSDRAPTRGHAAKFIGAPQVGAHGKAARHPLQHHSDRAVARQKEMVCCLLLCNDDPSKINKEKVKAGSKEAHLMG
eukprot:SAG31_NODE_4288_length_3377_cov_4.228493_4_plen_90_part_00